MKRSFFQATALVVVSGFVLPLFVQPARADDSIILRCAPSFERCTRATTLPLCGGSIDRRPLRYSPYPANFGTCATQYVAKLGARYVFEGGPDFSQQPSPEASTGGFSSESFNPRSVGDRYAPAVRVGGTAGALNAPILAPDRERPYAQNGYSPLLNMQVLPANNAPRITDFAMFAAQGPKPAGFLVNYPVVVQIIRL